MVTLPVALPVGISLNRTNVELKQNLRYSQTCPGIGLNRTNVELKQAGVRFNAFMETWS